jgi:hypothetical protein
VVIGAFHTNHVSASVKLHGRSDPADWRKESREFDVGLQRRRACGQDECANITDVTRKAKAPMLRLLPVAPREPQGNSQPVPIVSSSLLARACR